MSDKYYVTWEEVLEGLELIDLPENSIYGIPKGGMIASAFLKNAEIVTDPNQANILLDDVIDSGSTREKYKEKFPGKDFVALFDKTRGDCDIGWIIFPWEVDILGNDTSVEDAVKRQLEYMGEDSCREGLIETPKRVVKAWDELFSGYNNDPEDVFKCFDGTGYGGLVYLKDIEFFSMCEHHLLPFYGKAHIGYIPNGRVIGVSKIARLLDIYARRAQIQERIAEQVVTALMKHLNPVGAACVIEAKHLCIACRGVRKQHSIMGYSAMRGVYLEDSHMGVAARNEFLGLIK